MERKRVALDKIAKGKAATEEKRSLDGKDKLEQAVVENDRLSQQVEEYRQRNADIEANRELRKEYANKVYRYLLWYSGSCGLLLLLSGFSESTRFKLPDTVLTVLVGSTAAAAIGLVGFVVNGLFRGGKGPN